MWLGAGAWSASLYIWLAGLRSLNWDEQVKNAPFAKIRLGPNPPTMSFRDSLANHQTISAEFTGKELGNIKPRNPLALVAN